MAGAVTPVVGTGEGTVVGTLPADTQAVPIQAGTSAGSALDSENTLPGMRESMHRLPPIHPIRHRTCGTLPRQPASHPFRVFHQLFSGLDH